MHICGAWGCDFRPDDDMCDEYVRESRMRWAGDYQQKHGEFPDTEKQINFVIRATGKYQRVVRPRLMRELHQRRLAVAETEARVEYMRRFIISSDV